jgi:hypothetical protein
MDFSREFLLSVWFAQEFDVGVETALMELANPGAILGRVEKVLCRLRQAKRSAGADLVSSTCIRRGR